MSHQQEEHEEEPTNPPRVLRGVEAPVERPVVRPLSASWNGGGSTVEVPGEAGTSDTAKTSGAFDFDAFCFTHEASLLAKVTRLCRGDRTSAEDIVQGTFRQAHRYRVQLAEKDDPEAWLHVVAANVAKNFFTREGRQRSLSRDPRLAGEQAPDDVEGQVLDRLERQEIARLVDRLPEPHRRLIRYRYWDARPIDEIAALLGVSRRSVNYAIKRAHSALRRMINEAEGGGS